MGWTDIINNIGELLDDTVTSFDSMTQKAADVLTSGISGDLWNKVVTYSENLVPFCNIIIGICMMLELAQIASKVDLIKWEHGLKVGIKMVIAKVCIEVVPAFLHACYLQANDFILKLSTAGSAVSLSGTVINHIDDQIGNISGFGSAISLLVSTIILQLAIKICGIMVLVMAYGRMFEILVYLVVSPIPAAFACYNEGHDGISRITMRFLKNFIAVCLQGVMMLMCLRLFDIICGTVFDSFIQDAVASTASHVAVLSSLCYDILLFCIVLVMALGKCGSWAKSIMDAG